jgi:Tfp pilus assembly protein PilP
MLALTFPEAWLDVPHQLRRWRAFAMAPWPLWGWSVAAMVCASLGAALAWCVLPEVPDTTKLQSKTQEAQSRLDTQGQRLRVLRAEAAQQTQLQGSSGLAWPNAHESEAVLWALFEQTQRQSLQVDSFQPEPLQTVQGWTTRSVQVRLQGPFGQVLAWSDGLFQQAALWVPEQWRLKAGTDGQVQLEAVLRLQIRSEPEAATQAPSQATPSGPMFGPVRNPFQAKSVLQAQPQAVDPQAHPLVRWPLQQLKLVGVFSHQQQWHAVVQTPAGIYAVKQGDRLGTEGGRVLAVKDTALEVRVPLVSKAQTLGEGHQVLTLAPLMH